MAVNAIQAATDRAVGFDLRITNPDINIPIPITIMPPIPEIKAASCVANLNCDSRYFGKKVYSPAIGSKCSTDDAVRNIKISFFNCRFMAFGKSLNFGRESSSCCFNFFAASISLNFSGGGMRFPFKCFGKLNIAIAANIIQQEINKMPSHQAPTHLGSDVP